jgi:GNAT superfamily N-acetyltransferase
MSGARAWRTSRALDGPYQATVADIPALNEVFSEAFTERYRRDGMTGVRVPNLNRSIWRYAIEDAGEGAMYWRGEQEQIVAFNMAHASSSEGWMGPLAIRPDHQGAGGGKKLVRAGVDWLLSQNVSTVGLETMPRTMDNIGFYSMLGFEPGRLTITVSLEPGTARGNPVLAGRLSASAREEIVDGCQELLAELVTGYDFRREMRLTDALSLGDTVVVMDGDSVGGFAICHTVPLVEGRAREELRVLKLAVRNGQMRELVQAVADFARRSGTRRAAIRVQGEYPEFYRTLMQAGGRVRWTDLRMTLAGKPEPVARGGVVLSNWEI